MRDLASLRREYARSSMTLESAHKDPIAQFQMWMDQAIGTGVHEPTAMTLSTASADGRPSSRVALLKGLTGGKFIFYTNYQSRKGKELYHNPACALNFFWPELERQVSVRGLAQPISAADSDAYFQSRPRESQVGAWASPQSSLVASREALEERCKAIEQRYTHGATIPRPKQWGGYGVDPYEIEFWQGRVGRLHDRIVYYRQDDRWAIYRLAP